MRSKIKLLMDPVSNQIIQKIRVKGMMSPAQLLNDNIECARATLYRKIEKMLDEGIIEIAETRIVMGQEERYYRIKDIYITDDSEPSEKMKTVTMGLRNIEYQFDQYFKGDNPDVNKDKLFLMNYNIALSDSEYKEMLREMLAVVDRYQHISSGRKNRKNRNIYLISAPGKEQQ